MRITAELIQSFNSCRVGLDNYLKHFGTKETDLVSILESENIPHKHKIWLATKVLPNDVIEIFAWDCAFHAAAYAAAAYAADADAAAAAAAADAADAAAAYAAYAADADAADAEVQRQVEALIWIIENQ